MDEAQRDKILKSTPFLKGRSEKSIEKTADSFLDLSNKLFAVIFLSFITVPLAGLVKNLGSSSSSSTISIDTLAIFISTNGIVLGLLVGVGVFWAWRFRTIALNLYDTLKS